MLFKTVFAISLYFITSHILRSSALLEFHIVSLHKESGSVTFINFSQFYVCL